MTLQWAVPAASRCPSEAEVRERLAAHLGPAEPGQVQVALAVDVEGDERRGWTARLESAAGRRVLSAESCETLARAVVVAAALLVDPRVLPPPPSPDATAPAAPPASAASPAPPPAPRGPPASERAISVGLRGFVDGGLLPGAATGAALAVGRRWGALRGEARAGYWPARATESVLSAPPVHGTISLAALSVAMCGGPGRSPWHWEVCGGAEGGRFAARAVGTSQPTGAGAPWLALTAGASLRWRASERWGVGLEPGVALPLSRPRFRLGDVPIDLHQPESAVVRFSAGVDAFF